MRIGFLMDPLDTVRVDHDTTFALMLEAQRRGHQVLAFEQRDLTYAGSGASALMRTVELSRAQGSHYRVTRSGMTRIAELDALFLRKDPPVDTNFLHATQLVELCGGFAPLFVNSPAALRDANEKLFSLRFPELTPRTLVSEDLEMLRAFVEEIAPEAILKPVDGFGGRGILSVRKGDRNLGSLLDLATNGGTQKVVLQAFIPEVRVGDKRILLLDGEPLGAVLRVPREDDVRANMAAGGKPVKTTLTKREQEICEAIAPELRRRGLFFVGIDVIGDYLTEINVTSPTGLVEIEALDGSRIAEGVISFVENRAAARRAN